MIEYMPHVPDILTPGEAAKALRISRDELATLVVSGEIPCIRIAGKPLVLKSLLTAYLEKRLLSRYTVGVPSSSPTTRYLEERHLENCIMRPAFMPLSEGDNTDMASKHKINQPVYVNGEKRWITADTMQEFADKVVKLVSTPQDHGKHPFDEYAWNWFHTYSKPSVATVTATTYERQLRVYLIPAFQGLAVEDIGPDEVQRLFNRMSGAKTTKDKARMVLNQILDAAVEDKLIPQNPAKSRRVRITGKASKPTPPYSVEQMRYLVQHIQDVQNSRDRAFLALQALHPLRLEEVLGLQPGDIDTDRMAIHIHRAVTHPTRNQPEIKDTKTTSSHRTIGLSALALPYLQIEAAGEFLFGGDKPLSYTQVRKMCQRIQRDTGFAESITPIRFRTTVLTDLYDQTKDIKLAQAAAGHTTSAMTLKYYVKGRETSSEAAAAVDQLYAG